MGQAGRRIGRSIDEAADAAQAEQDGDWAEAAALWEAAAQVAPGRAGYCLERRALALHAGGIIDLLRTPPRGRPGDPAWRGAQAARVQLALDEGLIETAREAVVALTIADPHELPARTAYLRWLIDHGASATVDDELESGLFQPAENAASLGLRLRALLWRQRWQEAQATVAPAIRRARNERELAALFPALARGLDGRRLTLAWEMMQRRLDSIAEQTPPRALGHVLALRLMVALGDHTGFLERFASCAASLPRDWVAPCRRLAEILAAPSLPDFAAPKVFGIGLAKTGTTSLARAMSELGFSTAHYVNPFSGAVLETRDYPLFDFAGDAPVAVEMEALALTYPNARFIHTVRPVPDWAKSLEGHLEQWRGTPDRHAVLAQWTATGPALARPREASLHAALYANPPSLEAAWRQHEARIARLFADQPNRLLTLDMFSGQGWPELCAFLGRPVPVTPFPHANRRRAGEADGDGAPS